MKVLVVLEKKHEKILSPLIRVWRSKKFRVQFKWYDGEDVPHQREIAEAAGNSDSVMILVPAGRAPSTLVSGPLLHLKGKKIPLALVPVSNERSLKNFVDAAVEIHQRINTNSPVIFLAQQLPRYLKVTDKILQELENDPGKINTCKWTSDVIFPGDMLYGINQGSGLSVYMGHGRTTGWAGYSGVRSHHLNHFKNKPSAAIFSICCWTAGRKNVKRSFCEMLLQEGIAATALGAIKPTLFTDNTRWAINLSAALQNGVSTVGELIVNSCPVNMNASKTYRLFGDPTVPLAADKKFLSFARKIKTYE
jgi:hypothetical protein